MKENRIQLAAKAIAEADLEAVVYGIGANFQYLLECNDYYWQRHAMTNIEGRHTSYLQPEVLLYLNANGEYNILTNRHNKDYFLSRYPGHVTVSYMDQFEDALAPFIHEKRVGVGISSKDYISAMLHEIDPEVQVSDAEDILKDIRVCKDPDEIKALRFMAKFTDDANMYVFEHLKDGMTQREAENLVIEYGLMNGIDDLSFTPTVGFKTQNTITTENVEYYDREWKLQPQTGIAFDIGYMHNGYCSDWGRSLYRGKAPERIKKAYEALHAGLQHMVDSIVPYQTNNNELYRLVHERVTELGFGEDLRFQKEQMLGHQIGIDCHEFPMVNKDYDFILKPGMVFAAEPKMWFKGEMYMRVEDMILVTETGAEFLTNFPRDLFEF
ncbi:MAG: aminopeptidase P family protein [Oscillospiraceae bacterium]|nr:aminopeptidase P family protein [Oscillospiraceae bacterium]